MNATQQISQATQAIIADLRLKLPSTVNVYAESTSIIIDFGAYIAEIHEDQIEEYAQEINK